MKHAFFLAAPAMAFACLLPGCQTTQPGGSNAPAIRIENGTVQLPDAQYLVAAGRMMAFVAPSDGNCVIAEVTSQKILGTQHLAKGKTFDDITIEPDSEAEAMVSKLAGVEPDALQLVLYFIPDPKPANDTFIRYEDGKLLTPDDKYLVAIGNTVVFQPPFSGTMVVFETTTNTPIVMTSTQTPPTFTSYQNDVVKRFSEKENIPVEDMQFAVYFTPSH